MKKKALILGITGQDGSFMAELLLKGRYETIDLKRFGWQRLLDDMPLREEGII